MKTQSLSRLATLCLALCALTMGCNSTPTDSAANTADSTEPRALGATKPDMNAVKAEIQALENQLAAADNARDAKAVTAFYADDAVSMNDDAPMLVGKAAIQKDYEAQLAKRPQGVTTSFEIMDVFGDENTVTEVGKAIRKDASGKVVTSGKYMAIWEKRDGKYLCVRDISNDDQKAK